MNWIPASQPPSRQFPPLPVIVAIPRKDGKEQGYKVEGAFYFHGFEDGESYPVDNVAFWQPMPPPPSSGTVVPTQSGRSVDGEPLLDDLAAHVRALKLYADSIAEHWKAAKKTGV